METAPLHNALAEGPEGGRAFWIKAEDGLRLRAGHWPGGQRGTVFLLPGRTEYVEKYGRAATDLAVRGFGTLTIDWRGQGLADRMLDDPTIGHVGKFGDYQLDLAALVALAAALGLPEPYFLIAHSMGGCIGLRALHDDRPFKSAVFTGPMWGIAANPLLRPVGWTVSRLSHSLGLATARVPTTSAETYVLATPFKGNMLTSDEDMWDYMRRQTEQIAGLDLAGPSLQWLHEALLETRALRRLGPTRHPVITYLGGNERIVDRQAVRRLMARWPNGRLEVCPGCEHEIMMEGAAQRKTLFDAAAELFGAGA